MRTLPLSSSCRSFRSTRPSAERAGNANTRARKPQKSGRWVRTISPRPRFRFALLERHPGERPPRPCVALSVSASGASGTTSSVLAGGGAGKRPSVPQREQTAVRSAPRTTHTPRACSSMTTSATTRARGSRQVSQATTETAGTARVRSLLPVHGGHASDTSTRPSVAVFVVSSGGGGGARARRAANAGSSGGAFGRIR